MEKVKSWVPNTLSPDEEQMIANIVKLPIIFKHVALMPDAHLGIGSMVGSVVATKDSVIPATVGVDLSCGMAALKTPFKSSILEGKLSALRAEIEKSIPVGFNSHVDEQNQNWSGWSKFNTLFADVQDRFEKARLQMGTLGGGNHFLEVCIDTEDSVWLLLHSGSRNIGKEIAERHIKIAQTLHDLTDLPDPHLAYFLAGTKEMKEYMNDLHWAQSYAWENRETMLRLFKTAFNKIVNDGKEFIPRTTVNCHHNYVSEEVHFGENVIVTRKGAINAERGRLGIIPGSMGSRSFIVSGLGNPDSFNSCSHGAGRSMSRGKAKKTFTVADLEMQTKGIECRKDAGVLDEIPSAYKNIDVVMNAQKDLVEIVAELRQVVCVKG